MKSLKSYIHDFPHIPRLLLRSRHAGRCLFGGGSLGAFHLLFGSLGAFELEGSHEKCESRGGLLWIPRSEKKISEDLGPRDCRLELGWLMFLHVFSRCWGRGIPGFRNRSMCFLTWMIGRGFKWSVLFHWIIFPVDICGMGRGTTNQKGLFPKGFQLDSCLMYFLCDASCQWFPLSGSSHLVGWELSRSKGSKVITPVKKGTYPM